MEWEVEGFRVDKTLVSHLILLICITQDLLNKATKKICESHLEVLGSTFPINQKTHTQHIWRCPPSNTQRDKSNYKQVGSKAVVPKVVHMRGSLIINTIISKVICLNRYRYRLSHKKTIQDLFKFKVKELINKVALQWECYSKSKPEKNRFKCKMIQSLFMVLILSLVSNLTSATVMTVAPINKIWNKASHQIQLSKVNWQEIFPISAWVAQVHKMISLNVRYNK